MNKLTAASPEAQSADLVAGNIDQLKALFPDLITEGPNGTAVNVDVLKALVGDQTVTDADEKYGLNWHGKRRARQLALTPSTGTLRPCPDESVDWDTTQNLMIEGDNLEVLKLLQKSYAGKVKLIYIDPPYNTGKDFVYPDNFQDNIKNYQLLMGWRDDKGEKVSSRAKNSEAGGRFHTDWLNMMYPRLKLARSLLKEDGVLFVSIDQGELATVKILLDEIFGEENFVNIFSWVRTRTPAALSQKTKNVTEYIVCYERSHNDQPLLGIEKPAQSANTLLNQPNSVSILTFPEGIETGIPDGSLLPGLYGSSSYEVELLDKVSIYNGRFTSPFRLRARFRWSQAYLEEQISSGTKVRIASNKLLPSYEKASYGREALPNLIDDTVGVGTNESAGVELEKLMGARVFDYPKPVSLLRYLVASCTSGDDIVLDFFAGSGTTGHAVVAQNFADKGCRRFILVQLPEPLDPDSAAGKFCRDNGCASTISSLTKERLRRAFKSFEIQPGKGGFKSFALDRSNIRAWMPHMEDLHGTLLASVENILPDRTSLDILYEIALKMGLSLTTPIQSKQVGELMLYAIGGGVLFACLDRKILAKQAEILASEITSWRLELAPIGDPIALFIDTSFTDDVSKLNLSELLMQQGFQVRSI